MKKRKWKKTDKEPHSRKERRKKFSKAISMDMYHEHKSKPFHGIGDGATKRKIMSNADRRRMGIEQDPDLEDYQP